MKGLHANIKFVCQVDSKVLFKNTRAPDNAAPCSIETTNTRLRKDGFKNNACRSNKALFVAPFIWPFLRALLASLTMRYVNMQIGFNCLVFFAPQQRG